MVVGVIVSFLALPFTTSIAVVGRDRCQDCRHRFWPASETIGVTSIARFPSAFHVLNAVLLLLLCVVGPVIMRARAGAGKLPELTADMGRLFTCGFLLWASLGCHLLVYSVLKRRVSTPLIWAILFLLPGVLAGGLVFEASLPSVRMRSFLAHAELAPLPKSATDVRFCSRSGFFSGEVFVRFTAEPNGIKWFLAESPALQGQVPEQFSAAGIGLEQPTDSERNPILHQTGQHEYFTPRSTTPAWYKQEIRGPTRRYILQFPGYEGLGEVLVDDETNTVYIYMCFS